MKITIEEFELVYSSTVIQIKNYPIKVILPDNIEGDYTFLFNFLKNTSIKGATINLSPIDKFTIAFDFINFENEASLGNMELIPVGTLRQRPLYINYRVLMHNNTGNTLIFNFYIGKEVIIA